MIAWEGLQKRSKSAPAMAFSLRCIQAADVLIFHEVGEPAHIGPQKNN
jgi:hypothetical protein